MRLKSQHFIVVALFLPLIAAEFCAELSINCVLVSNRTVDENPFKKSHFFRGHESYGTCATHVHAMK